MNEFLTLLGLPAEPSLNFAQQLPTVAYKLLGSALAVLSLLLAARETMLLARDVRRNHADQGRVLFR